MKGKVNLSQQAFFGVLKQLKVELPTPEYKFHPVRKWRIDYAWINHKIALEVEGGVFIQGRHSRGVGMIKDMEKYNTLASEGWRVLRVTPTTLCKTEIIKLIIKTIGFYDNERI